MQAGYPKQSRDHTLIMQSVLHVWQVKAETEANLNLGTLGNLRWLFFLAWCLFDEFLNDVEITHGDIHGDINQVVK